MIKINISNYIIINVIFKYNNNEIFKLIVYFSIKMFSAKCNYEIYDKKLLIIIRVFEL